MTSKIIITGLLSLLIVAVSGVATSNTEGAKCEDIKYEGDPLKMPGKNHDDNNPSEKKFEKKVFGDATLCEVAFCHDNHECKGELKEHERDEVEDTIMWMSGSEEQIDCLEERYDLPDGGQEALQSYEVFDCAVGNY